MPQIRAASRRATSAWWGPALTVLSLLALTATGDAAALDYRATVDAATILYDGPSLKAQKVFVVGRDYPFEIVVNLEGWVKVRDMAGVPLAWVERKALGDRRIVVVKTPVADVLAAGESGAKTVFRAEQNVLLELVEPPVSGWAKVRHRDGQTGFISISQVWGL